MGFSSAKSELQEEIMVAPVHWSKIYPYSRHDLSRDLNSVKNNLNNSYNKWDKTRMWQLREGIRDSYR